MDSIVEIRSAIPEDAAEMASVHVQAWGESYAEIVPADALARLTVKNRERFWAEYIPVAEDRGAGVWVAEDGAGGDPRIIGFANAGPARDDDAVDEVYCIYLLRSCWDRGLGRQLLATCLDHCRTRARSTVTLWVLEANSRARRFYEKAGFEPDGARRVADVFGAALPKVRYGMEFDG